MEIVTKETIISDRDTKDHIEEILGNVAHGRTYLVTAGGRAVARIIPVSSDVALDEEAKQKLLTRLRRKSVIDIGQWTRAELYEEGE